MARERFMWLIRLAKLRGARVYMGPCEGSPESADEDEHKVIQINMDAHTARWRRWLLRTAGADVDADLAACK